jgi:hypothetical protein
LAATSFFTVSGVAATRVSPVRVSAGMPIFMEFSKKIKIAPESYTEINKSNCRTVLLAAEPPSTKSIPI